MARHFDLTPSGRFQTPTSSSVKGLMLSNNIENLGLLNNICSILDAKRRRFRKNNAKFYRMNFPVHDK
eukprot:752260-Hanusia_phi.AAC.5